MGSMCCVRELPVDLYPIVCVSGVDVREGTEYLHASPTPAWLRIKQPDSDFSFVDTMWLCFVLVSLSPNSP